MGRGRLMRTKKHEVVILTKAEEKARFQQEYANKMSEHGFLMSLRGHIGKALDKIDPLELAAIGGLTIVIEPMIEQELKAVTITFNTAINLVKVFEPFFTIFGPFQATVEGVVGALGNPKTQQVLVDQTQSLIDQNKIMFWIVAFVMAFCIIRWGDKMINAGIGGISGILKLAGLVAA